MLYDLHLHSALSPCADNNMTPSLIIGMMSLAKAQAVAITDHNSALNLVAAQKAAEFYNVTLLPGIEVNSAEEIHLLCYFSSVELALEMGEIVYQSLPDIAVDTSIWGEQLVMNEEDEVVGRIDKLLTLASSYSIYEIIRIVESLKGIVVPAHIDKESNSLLAIMGLMHSDLNISTVEFINPKLYQEYMDKGLLPKGLGILRSSDAHCIQQLAEDSLSTLVEDNPIYRLIKSI